MGGHRNRTKRPGAILSRLVAILVLALFLVPPGLAERALVDGRHRDAHDLFARMHEMAPQNALILNNLAWTASQVKDPKAFEYAEQALRLAPDNPAIIDTVASTLSGASCAMVGVLRARAAVAAASGVVSRYVDIRPSLIRCMMGIIVRMRIVCNMSSLLGGS